MGLSDLVSRVFVEMKGDTSDLKSKLKELSGIEKERAENLIKDIEKTNKSWAGAIETLGHVGLALDTLGKFTDYARESLKAYGEHMRLATATVGINIDRLSDAFGGLVTQHELLTFAAQTSKGVLALNQGQMETLGQAAVALQNRGFDLTESLKKLTDAAVKGKVGGLDDLGLSIKEGASKAETLRNMMRELNKVIAESGSTTANAADDIQRAAVQWDNMADSLKRVSAQAFLAVGSIDELKQRFMDQQWKDFRALFPDTNFYKGVANLNAGIAKGRKSVTDSEVIEMDTMDLGGDVSKLREDRKRRAQQLAAERAKLASDVAKALTDDLVKSFENGDFVDSVAEMGYGNINSGGMGDLGSLIQGQFAQMNAQNYESYRAGKQQSFLESTFGELQEFDAYASAFQMLTGAVTAGLDAWIDGSMSAGQAIKKFFADALKGLANQMAVEALKHGAYALGSLAFGDVRGAGQHAAAAAAFGVGAAAAAVAAKELGGSGSSAPTGAAGGSGGSAGGGSGSSGGPVQRQSTLIVYADPWAEQSARERALSAEKVVKKALGGSGGVDS